MPRPIRLLLDPRLTLRGKFEIKIPQDARDDKSHFIEGESVSFR